MLVKDKDILADKTTNVNIKIKKPHIQKENMRSAWGDAFDYYIRGITEKYLQFHGRASRLEFWGFMVVSGIVFFPLYLLSDYVEMPLLCYCYLLATLIPTVAVAARRLHDINKNAFIYLISGVILALTAFIPHVGYWAVIPVLAWCVYLIKLFFVKSDMTDNAYGQANEEDEIYGDDNLTILKKFRFIALVWLVFWCGLTYTKFDDWQRQESYIVSSWINTCAN